MNRLFITGDIHGDAVSRFKPRFEELKALDKDDIIFIVGDCGLPFGINNPAYEIAYKRHDMYQLDWLSQFDCTFLFLRGNHDDLDAINEMPQVEKYGGTLRQMLFDDKLYDNIFYIDDPTILVLCGKKCLCIPGGESHDISYRIEHWDWWRDEIIDIQKTNDLLANQQSEDGFDLILTHESPSLYINTRFFEPNEGEVFLDSIRRSFEFNDWYHGHMHNDCDYPKTLDDRMHCLYQNIVEIKED